jgi:uncharacterized protein YdhG (YjbR/CyaY superfamily)
MQTKAKTVAEYLKSLPSDRRSALETVRKVVLANLDRDIEECMQYGMIGYAVPHRVHPAGYHCDPKQPLPFAGLASQKNYMSLYLCSLYMDPGHMAQFRKEWARSGRKLDMGKSCIRFKNADDLPLDVIGRAVKAWDAKRFVELYQRGLGSRAGAKQPAARASEAGRKPSAASGAVKGRARTKARSKARP